MSKMNEIEQAIILAAGRSRRILVNQNQNAY